MGGGVPTSQFGAKTYYLTRFLPKNCMKMKEIGPRGHASVAFPGSANVPFPIGLGTKALFLSISVKKETWSSKVFLDQFLVSAPAPAYPEKNFLTVLLLRSHQVFAVNSIGEGVQHN